MGIVRRRARRRGLAVGMAAGAAMSNRNQGEGEDQPQEEPESTSGGVSDPAEEIKKLAELKDQGVLSQEEFDQKKKELLGL